MGRIIAGRINVHEHAEEIVGAVEGMGISRNKVSVFYVNPDGQHHLLPTGGDRSQSPGASDSPKGAWIGSGVGAAAGAAVGSVAGPIGAAAGAGVGAYTGSLAGAVGGTDDTDETSAQQDEDAQVADRRAGLHVAVEVDEDDRDSVVSLLRQYDGEQIEEADGRIEEGEWVDFDPARPAYLVS